MGARGRGSGACRQAGFGRHSVKGSLGWNPDATGEALRALPGHPQYPVVPSSIAACWAHSEVEASEGSYWPTTRIESRGFGDHQHAAVDQEAGGAFGSHRRRGERPGHNRRITGAMPRIVSELLGPTCEHRHRPPEGERRNDGRQPASTPLAAVEQGDGSTRPPPCQDQSGHATPRAHIEDRGVDADPKRVKGVGEPERMLHLRRHVASAQESQAPGFGEHPAQRRVDMRIGAQEPAGEGTITT